MLDLYVRKIDIGQQNTRKSCFSNKIVYKATFLKNVWKVKNNFVLYFT